jgi:hypothetical protein
MSLKCHPERFGNAAGCLSHYHEGLKGFSFFGESAIGELPFRIKFGL